MLQETLRGNNVKLQCSWQPLFHSYLRTNHTRLSTLQHRSQAFDVLCVSVRVDVIVRCDIWLCVGVCLISHSWQSEQVCVFRGNHHLVTQRDRSGCSIYTCILTTHTSIFSLGVFLLLLFFDYVLFDASPSFCSPLRLCCLSVCLIQANHTLWLAVMTPCRLWE